MTVQEKKTLLSRVSVEKKTKHRPETVMKLLQRHFQDPKIKVTNEAVALTTELLRIFVQEAALRSAEQAKDESSVVVEQKHLEKILPQLLLDF
ncbi:centromere protein X-like isoform X1 [Apostichopus japonicus]|uniref:centromere protein X-like isoform X1 n=1 Tax=Stichopus japonicus TaxID=307972 RepID=UPI003AB6A759